MTEHPDDGPRDTTELPDDVARDTSDLSDDVARDTSDLPDDVARDTSDLSDDVARDTSDLSDDVAGDSSELPDDVASEAERLTRLARKAASDAEASAYRDRRTELLDDHGFVARVRTEDDSLVCYPAEWVEDGTVQLERVEDTDRAVERSLSGAGDAEQWAELAAHNRELVADVADEHGAVHAANARAFADFLGNHYARRVEEATAEQVEEFLTEYYPRNAWPSEEEAAVVETSLARLFETADVEPPAITGGRRRDR